MTALKVSVGEVSVTLHVAPANSIIACGPVSYEVGPAAGRRFFDALTTIRMALLAADAVQRDDQAPSGLVTPSEVRLARLLVELEITSDRPEETP